MKHSRRRLLSQFTEILEPRTLFSYSLSPNSAVVLNTSLGEVAIQLDSDTPITTANFLSYVTGGSYNGTVFHRIAVDNSTQIGGQTETYSIVQGGGYTNDNGTFTPIATDAPIVNEASDEDPNTVGTIAMARTSSPDSATSQFFFNLTDNSSVFDADANEGQAGYAAFGNVIRGLGVIQTIDNLSPQTVGSFDNVPETTTGGFVTINTATEEDTLTVTIGPNDAGGDKSVTFIDPITKSKMTVSMANADATLTFTGTSLVPMRHGSNVFVTGSALQLQNISSTDSTAKTTLKIAGKSSTIFTINGNSTGGSPAVSYENSIGDINITGSIHSISGSAANLSGDINVTGGVNSIKFKSTSAAGFISLDTNSVANAPATTISIPTLSDVNIQSGAAIAKLTAKSVKVDDGTSRSIFASAIASVNVSGDLQAGIYVSGSLGTVKAGDATSYIAGNTIGSVSLKSLQEDGEIYSAAAYNSKTNGIGKVNISHAITNVYIISVGNIGSIKAASMTNSNIVAGYDTNTSDTPAGNFQFGLAANALLQSVTLKKPKSASATSFSDSEIDAYAIGSLNLGRIDITNTAAPTAVGVQAHTIQSLVAVNDENQSLKLSNITTQSQADTAVSQAQFALGSFTIDMI